METRYYFSQSQLQLIEAVVLAMVSDDFVLGQNARRWLDEDEFLVRRRIHRDVREVLAQAGM
jgi:cellulose synthase operon protein C